MKNKKPLEYLIMTVIVVPTIYFFLVKNFVLEGFKNVRLRNS
jgi:hypothetical protein